MEDGRPRAGPELRGAVEHLYIDAALDQLRAQGRPVAEDKVARLSPFVQYHLNFHGKYSLLLPELAGGRRALRNPDVDPHEDD